MLAHKTRAILLVSEENCVLPKRNAEVLTPKPQNVSLFGNKIFTVFSKLK